MDNHASGWVGGDRLIEHMLDMYFILYIVNNCPGYTHITHVLFFL